MIARNPLSNSRSWLVQTGHFWLSVLIVGGVLMLSIALPLNMPQRFLMLLIGLFIGVGVVMILVRLPALGMVLMIPVSIALPFEIGTGTNSGLNASILLLMLLAGLWILKLAVRKDVLQIADVRPVLPLLLFILVCVLAFASGQLPWFPIPPAPLTAQIGGLAIFVLSATAFLVVADQVREMHWLQWMTGLYLFFGVVVVVTRLVPVASQIAGGRIHPTATGSLLFVWLAALGFGQALFNHRLAIVWRVGLLLMVATTFQLTYVVLGSWKSGWIPSLVAIVTILVIRWWSFGLPFLIAGSALLGSLVSNLIATDEYSYATRIDAWLTLYEVIKVNPVLGVGPANYYWYTPLFPIRGFYLSFNSHSQYVDLLAQTGILGLICFLWFAWELCLLGWRLRTVAAPGFARAYVYGAMGGLVGTVVAGGLGDWILPFVYNVGLRGTRTSLLAWMFLGGLVALERMYARRPAAALGK